MGDPGRPRTVAAGFAGISSARWIGGVKPEHDLKSGLATPWPGFAEAEQ